MCVCACVCVYVCADWQVRVQHDCRRIYSAYTGDACNKSCASSRLVGRMRCNNYKCESAARRDAASIFNLHVSPGAKSLSQP